MSNRLLKATSFQLTQKMSCLHKDSAALFTEGLVSAHVGASNP